MVSLCFIKPILYKNNECFFILFHLKDTENLLAPMDFPVIYVMQYNDAVIPCKPSMEDYDVLLTTPSGSVSFWKAF